MLEAALLAAPPPAPLDLADPIWLGPLLALTAVALSGFLASLRLALLRSVPSRVLEDVQSDRARQRLEPLLERADSLALSASVLRLSSDLIFLVVVWSLVHGWVEQDLARLGLVLVLALPPLLLVGEVLPTVLSGPRADSLLRRCLPTFRVVQLPLHAVVVFLVAVRRAALRLTGVEEQPQSARPILEGLRDVLAGTDVEGELAETEREIIENAIEFRDVDVAEVMTPRTELEAVSLDAPQDEAVRVIAQSGHSRIPVHESNLDRIVGVVSARDVILRLAEGELETTALRDMMRPPVFVPETKLVSELLGEFRREKQKLAIVLDEYGGTAGLVTMGDILSELVGEIPDEWDPEEPAAILRLEGGSAEVSAAERISEVNEELELELPEEEDYETLGGFVLSELGHFPKEGERFVHQSVEFKVLEASDRRVLRVGVRPLARGKSA